MKTESSFNIQIWVGLKEGYSDIVHSMDDVRKVCDDWVNEIKDCVTITPTEFRYVNGNEPGVIVGYINYPRFPRTEKELIGRAIRLATLLKDELKQIRVSVVTPKFTYLLENY